MQKAENSNGDLIGNKIVDARVYSYDDTITEVSKTSLQNCLKMIKMIMIKKYIMKDVYRDR